MGQDVEAAEALRLALHSNPQYVRGRAFLAAAEALAANIDGARFQLAKLDELDPGMTIRRFVEERTSVPLNAVNLAYLRGNERMMEGLRRAGMPERPRLAANSAVTKAATHANAFASRILCGIRHMLLDGAAAYGAGIHCYASLDKPPTNTGEQRMSKLWAGE